MSQFENLKMIRNCCSDSAISMNSEKEFENEKMRKLKMKVLILCTGNSCRSQMAQGFLQSFDNNIEVYSAGTAPAKQINQKAVKVMAEAGVDISSHYPKQVDFYIHDEWDYVITVCDDANETCPVFTGKVKHR